jgi:hypothetical protein
MSLTKKLREELFGETEDGCCVKCKQRFSESNVFSDAGWRETEISQICEDCWDKMFSENQEDE